MKKWLFLLRAFIPSWRFFEDVGPELMLEVRDGAKPDQLGEWRRALPPIARSFPLINPRGNLLHACHNMLNHLSADMQEAAPIGTRPTYALAKNLARSAASGIYFQFRLTAGEEGEVLLSPVYTR